VFTGKKKKKKKKEETISQTRLKHSCHLVTDALSTCNRPRDLE
jgi:hypothetical protein